MSNELTRQLVHIILFTPAFLLPVVSRWQLGLILFGLLILSLTLVPYSGWKKYLFHDQNKKYSRGAIAYFGGTAACGYCAAQVSLTVIKYRALTWVPLVGGLVFAP